MSPARPAAPQNGIWRPALRGDLPAIELFLRVHEVEAAGLVSSLLEGNRVELPFSPRSSLFICASQDGDIVRAVLYCGANGLVYPLFADTPRDSDVQLAALVKNRHFDCVSAVGPARDVLRFESLFGLKGLVEVHYRLMRRLAPADRCRFDRNTDSDADGSPVLVRRAEAGDLEGLLPLQEAYEKEEVLTPIHRFDAGASRAGLAHSLRHELVVAALRDGEFAGKAATNARSFTYDQIGGVFVRPELRRKGIGGMLMRSLLDLLASQNKGAVLFVKLKNSAARALYSGLGFEEIEDYRADYYEP